MDVNKLGMGQRIAAGAAVLLFIDLFLGWYGPSEGEGASISAWTAFGFTDLLLMVTILVALAMAAQAMGLLSLPVKLSTVLLPLAAVMTLIVLYRISINQPLVPNDVISNSLGAYLGFLLTAAIAYGAYRAQDEHEDVAASGTYKVGSKSGTMSSPTSDSGSTSSTPPAPTTPPAAPTTPAPTSPPPATTPRADDPPPPPPASTTP